MSRPASHRTVITGAASGIGRALALRLHRAGHELVLVDAAGEALAALVEQLGGTATVPAVESAVVDVTDSNAVHATFARLGGAGDAAGTGASAPSVAAAAADVTADAGHVTPHPITAVVHSAGVLRTALFADQHAGDMSMQVAVNLGGTFNVAHAALPHLRSSRGMLVMMGSAAAFWGPPEYAVYGATKAAVNTFAQSLRIELADDGVAVGVCNPLFVATPMLASETRLLAAQGSTHTADKVAAAIERGLRRRRAQIWVGWGERGIFLLSRLLFPLGHRVLLTRWRQARRLPVSPTPPQPGAAT